MKCSVCGKEHEAAQDCPEAAEFPPSSDPAHTKREMKYYLAEAFRIATWDSAAIHRTMEDPHALTYGLIVYAVAISAQLVWPIVLFLSEARYEHALIVASFVAILVLASAFLDLFRILLCNLLARHFGGTSGKLKQMASPLLLGSVTYLPAIIPVAGPVLAAVAWTAVIAKVLIETHRIGRTAAILISTGVGLMFYSLQVFAVLAFSH